MTLKLPAFDRHLVIDSVFLGLLFWATTAFRPFAGSAFIKWFSIAALAGLVLRQGNNRHFILLSIGLFSHSIGDFLLEIDGTNLLAGIGPFLIGHLLYIAVLWPYKNKFSNLSTRQKLSAGGLLIYAIGMLSLLLPQLNGIMLPAVVIYVTALTGLGVLAVTTSIKNGNWIAGGIISYMLSDSIIALNAFVMPLDWSAWVTWPTYYGAQFIIAFAIIDALKTKSDRQTA